jgi:hypothetical protein
MLCMADEWSSLCVNLQLGQYRDMCVKEVTRNGIAL